VTLAVLSATPVTPVLPGAEPSTGEAVLFWILAPLMVLGALGLLRVKKAVHGAVLMAAVMICLAVLYAAQDAMFLFSAQVVVYTGAVMMLFLFVLMLVGVDTRESLAETLKGQKWIGLLFGAGLAFFLIAAVVGIDASFNNVSLIKLTEWRHDPPVGLSQANADTNPVGVARYVFGPYVFTFEVIGTLLVIAAVGAIVLTHRERLVPKRDQRHMSTRRVRAGTRKTDKGWTVLAPLPAPGVFARHNAVDTPALLPDGSASELSVSRVLRARGQDQHVDTYDGQVATIVDEIDVRHTLPETPTEAPEAEDGDQP
jgi:NADH-quinone oxidoreductase subunit J